MSFAALIPFAILFACFAGLRMALTQAAFIALLACTALSGTLFHATPEMWNLSLLQTGEFFVEIGVILVGCFFFVEVAQRHHILSSLAELIRSVSKDRVVQAVLVTFPMELMVEGSSGFGTPLLIIAPILLALKFPIELCALLPMVNIISGIPFGALGTPIRLGFHPTGPLSLQITSQLLPFVFIGPFLTAFLVHRLDRTSEQNQSPFFKRILWLLILCTTYALITHAVSKSGPEFPALAAGFGTFLVGIVSGKMLFKDLPLSHLFRHRRGIVTYGVLLFLLWAGKQIWMDRLIPDTHIRIFNPGFVFILYGIALLVFLKRAHAGAALIEKAQRTWARARRTLFVFFCMTFIVQQLRNNGALEELTLSLPSFLLTSGAPILGWLGSVLIGTSTVANLLLSKVVDPSFYAPLGAGSAIGVQLAFQSITALRSVLNEQISEKRIFQLLAPLSVGFMLILFLISTVIYYGH